MVAEAVAGHLRAVQLSVDTIEDALLAAGLPRGWTTGVAAYEAARAAAEQNLLLGHTVVVDAVNDSDPARNTWRSAARSADCPIMFVLLTPPEPAEHRRRLTGRTRGLAHIPEPTWEQVEARARAYEPWPAEPDLVDSGQRPDLVVEQVLVLLQDR